MAISPVNTGLNPMHSIKDSRDLTPSPPGACMTDKRIPRILTLWAHYLVTVRVNLRKVYHPLFWSAPNFLLLYRRRRNRQDYSLSSRTSAT